MIEFLRSERAGGALLILASALALAWANSGAGGAYVRMVHAPLGPLQAGAWVNEGLMAVFFLLVGLELRREITEGELSSPAKLAAPASPRSAA